MPPEKETVAAPQPDTKTEVTKARPKSDFTNDEDFLKQFEGDKTITVKYNGHKTDKAYAPTDTLITDWGTAKRGEAIELPEKAVELLKTHGHRFTEVATDEQ